MKGQPLASGPMLKSGVSVDSPILTVALGSLAALCAGLALVGGLSQAWEIGFTAGLGIASGSAVILAVAFRCLRCGKREAADLKAPSINPPTSHIAEEAHHSKPALSSSSSTHEPQPTVTYIEDLIPSIEAETESKSSSFSTNVERSSEKVEIHHNPLELPKPSIAYEDLLSHEATQFHDLTHARYWTQFDRKDAGFHGSQAVKFHISIERSKKNLTQAYNVICPILEKHTIQCFKLIPPQKRKNIDFQGAAGNTLGKEFVIYVSQKDQKEGSLQFWSQTLLREVVEGLTKAKVVPGPNPKGDIAIEGGNRFIYSRAPQNCCDRYLSADLLEKCGFTNEEAGFLSPAPHLEMVIHNSQKRPANKPEKVAFVAPESLEYQKEEVITLYEQFENDLKSRYSVKSWTEEYSVPALACLINGMAAKALPISSLLETLFQDNEQLRNDYFGPAMQKASVNLEFFRPILMRAAFVTSLIRRELGIEKNVPTGNILSAFYTHLIRPIHQRRKETKYKAPLTLQPHEKLSFISQIALCALRKRESFPSPVNLEIQKGQIQRILQSFREEL